jgi:hypothetical protein
MREPRYQSRTVGKKFKAASPPAFAVLSLRVVPSALRVRSFLFLNGSKNYNS